MMRDQRIGALLRELRVKAHRSQSDQAEVLSDLAGTAVTRNQVSRWENEKRTPGPYWQRHLAASFGVPAMDLRRAVSASRAAERYGWQRIDSDEDARVLRRDFLGSAVVAGLATGLPDFIQPVAGRRVSSDVVALLHRRIARLRRLDDILGGADTFQIYAAEAEATTNLLKQASYTAATGRDLLAIAAEQAQQAGWAAFDSGRHADAERFYSTSLRAAKEAASPLLAGNSLAHLSYQQTSTGHSGIEAATASCDTAGDHAPSAVRALLLGRLAWAHAVAGDAGETERALASAESAVASADSKTVPGWAEWMDHTQAQIVAGRCWTELHRPLRAIPVLESALAVYDDSHARDKSLYLTWLAESYIDAAEVEQATSVTNRALDLSAGIGSVRPRQRVMTVIRRLAQHHNLPQVAELMERAAN
jgi:transcriptional regulator with XRE-family HTH domain/tetratricopeptide (TPR) repeat protein